jgi:Xaa-Pro dipeptidase
MTTLDIDVAACRARQRRLLAVMQERKLDRVIVVLSEHVQYLAGPRLAWVFQPAAVLDADGCLALVAPGRKPPEIAAADQFVGYEAQWHSTLRNDQRQASSEALIRALADRPKSARIGVEFSCFPPHLARALDAELVDIEPDLYRLRRRKDPDELARLRKAIAGTKKMYELARRIVAAGIHELEVFSRLQAAAVEEYGEMLTGTGNDYACCARGGPPRDRRAQQGELYILDLGPAFRGYFADNCRTLAVGRPDDRQLEAWSRIVPVFHLVEETVKPGRSARELFLEVQTMLDRAALGKFDHHLGHGIGLFPHEAPHLNPFWDERFEVGDVFTCEPGLYAPELRAGIRLENDYLVTETGVELLSDFPLELTL